LDAITQHAWERCSELALEEDSIVIKIVVNKGKHLLNGFVDVQSFFFRRYVPDKSANPRYHCASASCIGNDSCEGSTQDFGFEITVGEQPKACIAVIDDCGQRLIYFMGDGSYQFTHGCQSRNARKFRYRRPQRLLRLLPIMQIHGRPPSTSRVIFSVTNSWALEMHQR
jgi:hypothetical protein